MIAFNEEAPPFEDDEIPFAGLGEIVHDIFRENGYFNEYLKLEHRPHQSRMAKSIAKELTANLPLICEAGTGVGKSLAYLVPGIIHSLANKRKMLISAHTIALQEQLKQKDLRICKQLFEKIPELHPYKDFKYTILIGRGNYLCNYRLKQAIQTHTELFETDEFSELKRIEEWAQESKTGTRQELSPPPRPEVWEWISADSSSCNNKNCSHDTCFYRKARHYVNTSNLIILNHSLLFSLLNAGMSPENDTAGILFANDFAVLDEAHTVPAIATNHFGMSLSSYALDFNLKTLFNNKSNKGYLKKIPISKTSDYHLVTDVREQTKEFFDYLSNTFLATRDIFRIKEKNLMDAPFLIPMKKLADRLHYIYQMIDSEQQKQEIKEKYDRLLSHINGIRTFIELGEKDHVYWLERAGKRKSIVTLQSAPLDVSPILRENLFLRKTSVVMTSATLSLQSNMKHFQKQTGSESAKYSIETSPFDFDKSMRIYAADDMPVLTQDKKQQYLEYLSDQIQFCVEQRAGGTLVLFTSYYDMNAVADITEMEMENTGRLLLVQGRDYSRTDIINKFKAEGNAVLMGTDTFWTGIDIPGKALSQVIICKLPFDNPSHPIQEAKCEHVQSLGLSPFNEIMLPDALIKFKQGIGRLIRSQKDRGFITILDSRILQKSYGRLFLDCLPHQRVKIFNKQNRKEVFG